MHDDIGAHDLAQGAAVYAFLGQAHGAGGGLDEVHHVGGAAIFQGGDQGAALRQIDAQGFFAIDRFARRHGALGIVAVPQGRRGDIDQIRRRDNAAGVLQNAQLRVFGHGIGASLGGGVPGAGIGETGMLDQVGDHAPPHDAQADDPGLVPRFRHYSVSSFSPPRLGATTSNIMVKSSSIANSCSTTATSPSIAKSPAAAAAATSV